MWLASASFTVASNWGCLYWSHHLANNPGIITSERDSVKHNRCGMADSLLSLVCSCVELSASMQNKQVQLAEQAQTQPNRKTLTGRLLYFVLTTDLDDPSAACK